MFTMNHNFRPKENSFYFEDSYFIMEGDCFSMDKNEVFKIELNPHNYSMFLATKNGNLESFATICTKIGNEKPNKKVLFGFKLFNKQIYGRMKN